MYEFGRRGELRELAGDPVIETGTDRDNQVRLIHRVVCAAGTVHPEHAKPLVVPGREITEPHQSRGDREGVGVAELTQLGRSIAVRDASAGVDHRAPGVGHRLGRQPDLLQVALHGRPVAGEVNRIGPLLISDFSPGKVLGNVDQHRPRAAGGRDMKSLVDELRDVLGFGAEKGVLDDRHGDAYDVCFLKAVGADQVRADLAGDENGRN